MSKETTYKAIIGILPYGVTASEAFPIIIKRSKQMFPATSADEALKNLIKAYTLDRM